MYEMRIYGHRDAVPGLTKQCGVVFDSCLADGAGVGTTAAAPCPAPGPTSAKEAADRFVAAVALLPIGWAAATRAVRQARGRAASVPLSAAAVRQATDESVQQVVRGLRWVMAEGPPLMLLDYSVNAGTGLQMVPQLAALRAKHLLLCTMLVCRRRGQPWPRGRSPGLWPGCGG
jgi:hypothetical protein